MQFYQIIKMIDEIDLISELIPAELTNTFVNYFKSWLLAVKIMVVDNSEGLPINALEVNVNATFGNLKDLLKRSAKKGIHL